jgi:uncharacterized protein (DUF433 family)
MLLPLDVKPLPLETDGDGIVRVAGTRVTLETLVGEFLRGATAEEIAADFPVLSLADVYAVIGYYLQDRDAVDAYLRERRLESDDARHENLAREDRKDLRERLLARRIPPAP